MVTVARQLHECNTQEFISAIFSEVDTVAVRPVETWTEADSRKCSRVDYRGVDHTLAVLLGSSTRLDLIFERSAAERTNLFFGVCPRVGSEHDFAWQIRVVRTLWADLDHCTPAQAVERCRAAGVPHPSIVVGSGSGAHVYWLLSEPYLIDDAGDGGRAPAVKTEWMEIDGVRRPIRYYRGPSGLIYLDDPATGRKIHWPELTPKAQLAQSVMAGIAERIGGDATQDLARLLRLPGSLNRKDERNGRIPLPCEVASSPPTC